MNLYHNFYKSPVGELKLIASNQGLVAVLWENDSPRRVRLSQTEHSDEHPILQETRQQLAEYFEGRRRQFSVTLTPHGTDFQRQIWMALAKIPYAETRSYGQLAKSIGNPSASRAVGAANGKNPISIIVPCHRVVGAGGQLTGFAGGLEAKKFLLNLEGGDYR